MKLWNKYVSIVRKYNYTILNDEAYMKSYDCGYIFSNDAVGLCDFGHNYSTINIIDMFVDNTDYIRGDLYFSLDPSGKIYSYSCLNNKNCPYDDNILAEILLLYNDVECNKIDITDIKITPND